MPKHCRKCQQPGHSAWLCPIKDPCKYCGGFGHLEFACYHKPKPGTKRYKQLNPAGKETRKWQSTRTKWFDENPFPYYQCHYCGKGIPKSETTLDHKEARSRRPDLRHELDNLVPCCWTCNGLKGSRSHDEFCVMCDSPTLP